MSYREKKFDGRQSYAVRLERKRFSAASMIAVQAMLACFAVTPSVAQVDIPSTLEPARPEENLLEGPTIKSVPRQAAPLVHKEIAPEAASEMTFVFHEMRIEGVEALAQEKLMALWPFDPGETASVKDLFRFANAITSAYSQEGFALSFALVPEQSIDDGEVVVRVVEGFVDDIEFVGVKADELRGSAVLRRAYKIASKIRRSRPLKTADLERYILLINDLPGMQVSSVLKPSSSKVGAAVLALEVEDRKSVGVGVDYNNYMPSSLDSHIASLSTSLNGVIFGHEQIGVSARRSVTSSAYWSVSGNGSIALGAEGMRVDVSGLYSRSDPNTDLLRALEYQNEMTRGSVFVSYPLIRGRARNLILSGSFSVLNSRAEILDAPLNRDRLRSFGVSASYDFADATRAVTYINAGLSRGLDIFNAVGDSRANGELKSTIANIEVQRTQPLRSFYGGDLSVQVAVRGQGVFGPGGLFSNDECAFGGRRFGRAYESGVLTGEHCALGFGELRWRRDVGQFNTTFYGYVDGGSLWQKGALEPAEIRRRLAASGGLGMRILLTNRVSGVVETGWALSAPTGAKEGTDNFRVNAGLRAHF